MPFNPIGTQNGVIEDLIAPWTVPTSNITSESAGVSFKSIRLAIQPGIWHNANSISSPFNFAVTNIKTPTAGNGPFCDWSQGADGSGACRASLSAPNLLTAKPSINLMLKAFNVMLDFHHRPVA